MFSDVGPFACPECPKIIRLASVFKQHMLTHVKVKPIECSFCGEQFTQSDGLQKHQAEYCPGHGNNEASLIPTEDTGDVCNVDDFNFEIITEHSDSAKDEDIVSLPAPLSLHEEVSENSCEIVEITTKHSYNTKNEDITSLPAPVPAIRKRQPDNETRIETIPQEVECEYCHKFFRRGYLEKHKRLHKMFHQKATRAAHPDTGPFACTECPKIFRLAEMFKQHMLTHPKIKLIECSFCGEQFTQSDGLQMHLAKGCQEPRKNEASLIHADDTGNGSNVDEVNIETMNLSGKLPYKCKLCPKYYRHKSSLSEHMQLHSVKQPSFKCKICDKTFQYRTSCVRHITTHSNVRPYACPKCPKRFYRNYVLNEHMKTHAGIKLIDCNFCGNRFSHQCSLRKHLVRHCKLKDASLKAAEDTGDKKSNNNQKQIYNERPYKCDICGKSFYDKSNHQNHYATHFDARPFACSECPKRFKLKEVLKNHMKTHAGVKLLECTFCGNRFTSHRALQLHLKRFCKVLKNKDASTKPAEDTEDTNIGRVYTCDICGKTFKTKSIHDTHYTIHSDAMPFACTECPMKFRNNTLCKQHMLLHAKFNLRKIECTFCFNRFTTSYGLKRHQTEFCKVLQKNKASLV